MTRGRRGRWKFGMRSECWYVTYESGVRAATNRGHGSEVVRVVVVVDVLLQRSTLGNDTENDNGAK